MLHATMSFLCSNGGRYNEKIQNKNWHNMTIFKIFVEIFSLQRFENTRELDIFLNRHIKKVFRCYGFIWSLYLDFFY